MGEDEVLVNAYIKLISGCHVKANSRMTPCHGRVWILKVLFGFKGTCGVPAEKRWKSGNGLPGHLHPILGQYAIFAEYGDLFLHGGGNQQSVKRVAVDKGQGGGCYGGFKTDGMRSQGK